MTNSNIYITMRDWITLVEKQGTFNVETIMEIGSMNGLDTWVLFDLYKPKRAIVVEAHPVFAVAISDCYPLATMPPPKCQKNALICPYMFVYYWLW